MPEDRKKIVDYDIDVLINNAGMGESGSLAEIDVKKIRNNFEVNVFGPLELTQLALKKMVKKDSGTVIFIGSLVGRIAFPFLGSYCMTVFSFRRGRCSAARVTQGYEECPCFYCGTWGIPHRI